MCPHEKQHHDDRPCAKCGSPNHGTAGHDRLIRAYVQWGLGLTSLAPQTELDLAGEPGAPSPSPNDSVRPDRLQIVPFTISAGGRAVCRSAGILRLWKQDPEDGFTCMLSWDPSSAVLRESFLDALSGALGSVVTVELDLSRLSLDVAQPTT